MTKFNSFAAVAALGFALTGISAHAQDAVEATPPVTITGTAAFLTDYRFRGVSLSDRDIAGQASITATSSFGLFASIWGSTIEPIGGYTDSSGESHNGSEQEIDLTAGFSKAFGNITPTVGVIGYIYPGGKNVAYYEPFVSVAGTFGPVALTVGANYAPDQDNLVDDNIYVYGLASIGVPNTPLTVKASLGYEEGALDYGSDGKVDYMVGVDYKYKFLTVGVQYIGNDLDRSFTGVSQTFRHNSKDGVVASVTAAF
jgi:uncharacterized protein (TIGR02001 family)